MNQLEPVDDVSIVFDFEQDASNYKRRVWVSLKIEGAELLGWDDEPGTPVILCRTWIHSFATGSLLCLVASHFLGGSSIGVTESEGLNFDREGDLVKVSSDIAHETVTVKFQDFLRAWTSFAEKVREIVTQRQPEMNDYPEWRAIKDPEQYFYSKDNNRLPERCWFEGDDEQENEWMEQEFEYNLSFYKND
jgi:hypothetical protein